MINSTLAYLPHRSDHIVFCSEDAAFEGLLRWITHRVDERLGCFEELLPCVRLTLVSNDYLTENILNNKIILENENARDLVKVRGRKRKGVLG